MHKDIGSWLEGVFLPVTTPFDTVTGDVAPVSFRENLRRWLAEPIDGIVLFGSTGEGVLLEDEEKLRLLGYARELVPPLMPLIAGASAESTRAVLRLARQFAEGGADAILVHPPWYYGPGLPPAAMRDHFLSVADDSPVPVVVYHIPKFTNVVLEPGMVGELARHPNIIGIKDSAGEVKRLADYSQVCAKECRLLVGNGALFYTALELGAAGGILAIGLLAPARCAAIFRHFHANEPKDAGALQERLVAVHRAIPQAFGARGIKVALDQIGYYGGPPRAPLRPLSEAERGDVARVMQRAGLA